MTHHTIIQTEEFPCSDEKGWRELALKALRGLDFDSTLVKRSEDGIPLGPLFNTAPLTNNTLRTKTKMPHLSNRNWHITPFYDHPNIEHSNTDILNDLNGGASALSLALDSNGMNGITIRKYNDFQRLFSSVHTDLVPINIFPSEYGFENAALCATYFQAKADLSAIHINLGYAPLILDVKKAMSLAKWVHTNAPHWHALSVNTCLAHESGASPAQELAFLAFQQASYTHVLTQAGLPIDKALSLIDIHLSCDQDAHQNLIKLRAARAIWHKISDSFGVQDRSYTLHAHTSKRMLAKSDPWANLLRIQAASFGAICGGADYITTLPFTHPIGLATPFARRIARNTQLMQMEESHLGHVQDPANGSYMHETLTQELAQKAWRIFQDMEAIRIAKNDEGAAHEWLDTKIKETHAKRMDKILKGETLLVGVNQFTKSDIRMAEVLKRPSVKAPKASLIQTDDFEIAITQVKAGHVLPSMPPSKLYAPVRLAEGVET